MKISIRLSYDDKLKVTLDVLTGLHESCVQDAYVVVEEIACSMKKNKDPSYWVSLLEDVFDDLFHIEQTIKHLDPSFKPFTRRDLIESI